MKPKNPDFTRTLEIITIPGFHPRSGVVSVVKADLNDPKVRLWLKDLICDAPESMRVAIGKLLGEDLETQSLRIKPKKNE
jgi:hypothetical protein